ncbi:TPA: aminoacyl-tRNA hydrolase [Candidatus Dependentiae bacterium]|nr:MAG: Class I peptide chain release factor [candidate division TM6 bacterium GW2011_GWE2_31_21]KKP53860.1 MAG: Class I peptide chain release factor [candidate division TM6 bacterium GW2011_GWF2_33_332]HBS47640.1 aminoacyl-tRNA hydrolase [Candidatus Dependentiae bacterium]HBZ73789.1 aminoacyl-tRNA hydrolase [Candidatus Dependentiae bacterium]
MSNDLVVNNEIVIPENEFEITTSRAGGPGGQHVNKSDTKITIRWNVKNTGVLSEELKMRVLQNLQSRLTSDGDLIVNNSESRSQMQNKENAFLRLAEIVKNALYVPKKRKKTKASKQAKEKRLKSKAIRSEVKKMRSKKYQDY